jgi:hypothetical protein
VVEELLVEFVSGMSGGGAIMGSFEQTQKLLAAFMPSEKVDNLMEEIRGPAGRTMWDKLGNVNEAVLANYLKNEYPQTVAVVLSKIKPEHSARVLAALPEDFALECVTRLLRRDAGQGRPFALGSGGGADLLHLVRREHPLGPRRRVGHLARGVEHRLEGEFPGSVGHQ